MVFNIRDFASKVSEYGGLASSNKFLMTIYPPPWYSQRAQSLITSGSINGARLGSAETANDPDTIIANPQNLAFLCDSTTLPGKSLQLTEYRPEGYGRLARLPIGVQHDPLTATFMLDNDHKVVQFFQLWMQEIVNTGSYDAGPNSSYRDRTLWEMSYKTNYATTISLRFFSDDMREVLEYIFYDAFPVQIGNTQIGWDMNNQIARMPVEFTYSTYTTLRDKLAVSVTNSRGNDMLTQISYLGTVAGIINNIGLPRNLQDAINTITNINSIF